MTDEPKFKRSGPFLIPVDWEDETAERSGKPIAIIGGIAPAQVKPPQQDDGELREAFMRHISNDPQFREASKSGKAFVIVGNR